MIKPNDLATNLKSCLKKKPAYLTKHDEPYPIVDRSEVKVRYDSDGNVITRAKTINAARFVALMHAEDV
jgi:hypothetical protein